MLDHANRRQVLTGGAALAAFASLPAYARSKDRAISADWPSIRQAIDDSVRDGYVPGAGAAIARGTDQADFLVAGVTGRKSTARVTPDTLWRCYSMTKPVTGMAAMLLIEDGKLTLDQNIADLLPEWANPRVAFNPEASLRSRPALAPVTVRTLMTHTAGIGYNIVSKGALLAEYLRLGLVPASASRMTLPGLSGTAPTAPSLKEFSERLATLPLMYDPGVVWSYSASLDLLGRVIEVAAGVPFDTFLQRRIFGPLGMTSTFFQVPQSESNRMTDNFLATPAGTILVDPAKDSIYYDKPPFPFGGAGLVSSMRDYDRFLAMLMGNGALGKTRIMKTETAHLSMSNLLHPKTKMTGMVTGQGFGAGGRVTLKPGPTGEGVGTFGWGGAASTIAWVDRTRGVRASGWSQIMTFGQQPFVDRFTKAVYAGL